MLDEMDDDRPAAFLDRDEAFDAEEIGSTQRHEDRHWLIEAGLKRQASID